MPKKLGIGWVRLVWKKCTVSICHISIVKIWPCNYIHIPIYYLPETIVSSPFRWRPKYNPPMRHPIEKFHPSHGGKNEVCFPCLSCHRSCLNEMKCGHLDWTQPINLSKQCSWNPFCTRMKLLSLCTCCVLNLWCFQFLFRVT